jgi:hypothetical protein
LNNNYILMIFEGKTTEPLIYNNLNKYFLNENDNTTIKAVYGTVIYQLYKDFFPEGELDEDLDLFPLIKENIQSIDGNELNNITREEVSQIYLFFDYDGHATNADDEKLQNMLQLFNNETEKGKLFISYPMVEAIKHLKDNVNFKDVIVESNKEYKNLVSQNCNYNLKGLSSLNQENWSLIISEHCKKANFIVNDNFEFPQNIIEQIRIFLCQKEKYIEKEKKVSVLSAFPMFLLDYYGINKFKD